MTTVTAPREHNDVIKPGEGITIAGHCMIKRTIAGTVSSFNLSAGQSRSFHGYAIQAHFKIIPLSGDVTVTVSEESDSDHDPCPELSPIYADDEEVLSPEQHGGVFGTIYRQYFTTTLSASLTSGDNVSAIVDSLIFFNTGANRLVAKGHAATGTADVFVQLSGTAGKGNLSLGASGWTIDGGYVDYTK